MRRRGITGHLPIGRRDTRSGITCAADQPPYREGVERLEAVADRLSDDQKRAFFDLLHATGLIDLARHKAAQHEAAARRERDHESASTAQLLAIMQSEVDPQVFQLLPTEYRSIAEAIVAQQATLEVPA